MSMRVAVAVGVIAVLVVPAIADAASRFRLVAVGENVVSADSRYVAFERGTSVRVLDTGSGRWLPLPAPAGCRFAGVGGFTALFSCVGPGPSETTAGVIGLATDSEQEFTTGSEAGGETADYRAIGREWIEAVWDEPHTIGGVTSYMHWRAGGGFTWFGGWDTPTTMPDLSSAGLVRRLCRPIRRFPDRHADSNSARTYLDVQLDGRYALVERPLGPKRAWELRRCGSGARLKRIRSANRPQLGEGWLTWSSSASARAYAPGRALRYRWTPNQIAPGAGERIRAVTHTARRLFITVARTGQEQRVYEKTLPSP